MRIFKYLCVAAVTCAAVTFADESIRFVPEPYPIGYANQGEVKHVVLKGANVSGKETSFRDVHSPNAQNSISLTPLGI